jgi:hypothetical protein
MLLLSFFSSLLAATTPTSEVGVESCPNLPETYQFSSIKCPIGFVNEGDKPIHVFDIHAVKSTDAVVPSNITVGPKERVYVEGTINTVNELGNAAHTFRFRTDDDHSADRGATAAVFVVSALDDVRPEIDFGTLDLAAAGSEKKLELTSHVAASFELTKILAAPDWLDVRIGANKQSLIAQVKAKADWGIHADFVKVETNLPNQKEVWITVKSDIHGEVIPAFNPYDMGLLRIGNVNEFKLLLTSRSGRGFRIGDIKYENFSGKANVVPCEPQREGCKTLFFQLSDIKTPGAINGRIKIDLPEFSRQLVLAIWGVIVPKDFQVKTLDADKMRHDAAGNASQSAASKDLDAAISDAVIVANEQIPAGAGPLLKWTISNGAAIHGFQIFRAIEVTGPFLLVNPFSIPSDAKGEGSVTYQYRDNTAEPGKTYWYYIGLLYRDGHKQQLSGPQKIVAK